MPIVVMLAVDAGILKTEGKHREDTAGQKKERSSTVKQKTVAGTGKNIKRWMIQLL